jgi:hypothetical protein
VNLHFIETKGFTQRMQELGLEPVLRALQAELSANPTMGDLDAGTGGLRKVRVPDPSRSKGKRSGARVHYLHLAESAVVYLLYVYSKDELATLTAAQKKALKKVVHAIRAEWRARSP